MNRMVGNQSQVNHLTIIHSDFHLLLSSFLLPFSLTINSPWLTLDAMGDNNIYNVRRPNLT